MRTLRAFWTETSGATSIEYALIAGFVSLAVVLGATAIGTRLLSRDFMPVASAIS